jgi:folate-dependent phosphoribosylglycinamide formyltransferase PurN
VEASRSGVLRADIVVVVSNHPAGGVFTKARDLGISFVHSPKGRTADDYRRIVADARADYVALSGWLGKVEGLDPRTTFNIHPALDLVRFGGRGFHGHHVHEAVMEAYRRGGVTHSGVTMHFATPKYDDPSGIFFQRKVAILPEDTAETLGRRVNSLEHRWQAVITDRVVQGQISWDGEDPRSIVGMDIEL